MEFTTVTDAGTWYDNSGLPRWEWFEGFSREDLVQWIWRRFDGIERDSDGVAYFHRGDERVSEDDAIAQYLNEHGENPADYGL